MRKIEYIFVLALFSILLVGCNLSKTTTTTANSTEEPITTNQDTTLTTSSYLTDTSVTTVQTTTTDVTTVSKTIYEVSFNSMGGEVVESVYVVDGGTITLPQINKEGFDFVGWFFGSAPNETQFTDSMVVTDNLTLNAKWNINQYTISFESNGGNEVNSITQDLIL